MPRGAKPGERRGGRAKGQPNKNTREAHEIMERLGVDPIENLALIADRRVSCGTCIDANRKPTGKTKYRLPEGKHAKDCQSQRFREAPCNCDGIAERTCESCYGTLWERIPVPDMLKASAELAQYKHPKRKAIEVTGEGGGPLQAAIQVTFVRASQ